MKKESYIPPPRAQREEADKIISFYIASLAVEFYSAATVGTSQSHFPTLGLPILL